MRRLASLLAAVALASACGTSPGPDPLVPHVALRLTDSTTGFGLALLDRLLAEPEAGNVFISPLSATLMLSMAASAAGGDTRAGMLKTLGLDPTIDPSGQIRQTIERLAQSDADAQLELAQAVWVKKSLVLNPAYVTRLRSDYHAQLANLDFAAPDASKAVNAWVDNATHHKITNLVDGFDPSTVGYLVNATYFHALWRTEFDTRAPGDFHSFAGDVKSVPMMKRDENVVVLRTPGYTAALLPYRGGRFSALLILPSDTLSPAGFATFLSDKNWSATLGYLHQATGHSLGGDCAEPNAAIAPDVALTCRASLVMPKFRLEYRKDLTDTLVAMGMPMSELPAFCSGCYLDQVVQKTYLEVDEKGTTAAAATGGAVLSALPMAMVVDHPFAFALIDNATDAPLFLGAIGDL
jgi:serpin B